MNLDARDPDELSTLVRAAQGGDTIAMNELLDALAPWVGRICGAIALDQGADAAQDALIIVFRRLRALREPAALRGWVRAIAAREAVRVAKRTPGAIQTELTDIPARGDGELATDIRDVLERLSPAHRAVLVLRDLEGLDEATAAAVLRLPEGTVKSRLHRARASFRKAWTQ